MSNLLSLRTYHSDSERRIPVIENRDIAARRPPLGAQSSQNSIGFSCGWEPLQSGEACIQRPQRVP